MLTRVPDLEYSTYSINNIHLSHPVSSDVKEKEKVLGLKYQMRCKGTTNLTHIAPISKQLPHRILRNHL